MKYLLIYRHAQTQPQVPPLSDHERALTPRGEEEAQHQGRLLAGTRFAPDYALCSSAKRTQQTLALTLAAAQLTIPTRMVQGLYLATPQDMLREIASVPKEVENLMLVGHNPGAHQLSIQLAAPLVENDEKLGRISFAYPPATITIFSLDIDRWQGIMSLEGAVIADVLIV